MAAVTNLPGRKTARLAALRNFAWLMTDKFLALTLGLFVFGLIARHYGPVGSGHYAYALALLQTALGLSLVCSAGALLPRLCRLKAGVTAALANVFVVRLGGSVLAALGTALFAVLTVNDPQRLAITIVMLCSVPLIEPFYTAVAYWQSRNDNRPPTISRATGLVARSVFVLLAVLLGAPIWVLAFAWLLEALVSAMLQTASLRKLAGFSSMARRVSRWRAAAFLRFGVRFLFGLALSNLFLRLDRIVLGSHLPAHDFGLYATAMQLVDVWLQIAYLIGFAAGPAFLYSALAQGRSIWAYWRVIASLASIGLVGLAVAAIFGRSILHLVFGADFSGGYPYLVTGMAFGVLLFVDQLVQLRITSSNRPFALAVKWSCACAVCVGVQFATLPTFGAFAGPLGLSLGLVAGWIGAWWSYDTKAARPHRAAQRSAGLSVPTPSLEQTRESFDRSQ